MKMKWKFITEILFANIQAGINDEAGTLVPCWHQGEWLPPFYKALLKTLQSFLKVKKCIDDFIKTCTEVKFT